MEQFDHQIFFFFNHTCHNSFLDKLMPLWRNQYFWLPLYTFFVAWVGLSCKKQGLIWLLALFLTVGITDTLSSKIIKKTVQRLRPCNDPELKTSVKLLVRCGGGYSFTSSHAANHFAAAIFLMGTLGRFLFVSKFTRTSINAALLFWAITISLGQVYVGVHYPSDVFFGGILGTSVAWVAIRFYYYATRKKIIIY
jgi:membrane-associated phospholipid phosphatase